MRYIIFLPLMFLVGCVGTDIPPGSSFVDRTLTDYSFIDVSSSCSIYHNINLSNETSPCILPQREMSMFYTETNNWSIMCCEYSSKCLEDTSLNIDEICLDTGGKYSGYVFNDKGFWMAQCCNEQGGSCYVDLNIDINNASTICDESYHQNTYGLNYNGTWNSMCCIGGLSE